MILVKISKISLNFQKNFINYKCSYELLQVAYTVYTSTENEYTEILNTFKLIMEINDFPDYENIDNIKKSEHLLRIKTLINIYR